MGVKVKNSTVESYLIWVGTYTPKKIFRFSILHRYRAEAIGTGEEQITQMGLLARTKANSTCISTEMS